MHSDSRPVARDGDYRPPNRGGGEYRAPRGGDGDYRPPRSGGNDRGGSSGDYRSRNENGVSRGGGGGGSAGTYRAPNGSSRTPASSSNAPTDDATRIRRLEEPKQPVTRQLFLFLSLNFLTFTIYFFFCSFRYLKIVTSFPICLPKTRPLTNQTVETNSRRRSQHKSPQGLAWSGGQRREVYQQKKNGKKNKRHWREDNTRHKITNVNVVCRFFFTFFLLFL